MPANLTPQYLEAERRFRDAKSADEKLSMIAEDQINQRAAA